MKADILFYAKLFLRRVHWFILIAGIFIAASLTTAKVLPSIYVSATQLLVEPPQIPTQLAAPTVQTAAQEELQIVQRRLTTRVNLLQIARELNVFPDIDTMSDDNIVAAMRRATNINSSARQGQATLMSISFESEDAQIAHAVSSRYVDMILRDNAEFRTERAGNTLEFFENEVDRLNSELEVLSAKLLKFNNENADALPSTLSFRLNQQTSLQNQIATIDRDIDILEDQRQRLIDIFQTTGTISANAAGNLTPEQQKLANLEAQLASALAVYSPTNPRIRLLEAQVAQQREVVRQEAGQSPNQQGASILDVQLADIDSQIETLKDQRATAQAALDKVVETIERSPAVSIQLGALTRDYNNIQTQYNNAVAGMAKAATGERIEVLSQGRRITVIDPPTVPTIPARPNRFLIAAGGSFIGIFLGLALVVAIELLNRSIRRPAEITRGLGIMPLATIPYVRTPVELVARRAAFTALFLAIVIGIPAGLYAIHTQLMPLDLIYDRIAGRFGTML